MSHDRTRRAGGLTVAAALALGLVVWWALPRAGHLPAEPPGPVAPGPARDTPDWLHPVPPAIVLRSAPALGGHPDTHPSFSEAFDAAIAPWQAGNYAEAALRLDALVQAYPNVADAHFYQGTAWLLAGVPVEAIGPLERAVSLTASPLDHEATWYLGLALLQSGRADDGRLAFLRGCQAGYAPACRAVAYLDGSAHQTSGRT